MNIKILKEGGTIVGDPHLGATIILLQGFVLLAI
jgi:hypothetical protein